MYDEGSNSVGYGLVSMSKEGLYTLEYYCVDVVGNKGTPDEKKFKVE